VKHFVANRSAGKITSVVTGIAAIICALGSDFDIYWSWSWNSIREIIAGLNELNLESLVSIAHKGRKTSQTIDRASFHALDKLLRCAGARLPVHVQDGSKSSAAEISY
jgi:hypothetical protein